MEERRRYSHGEIAAALAAYKAAGDNAAQAEKATGIPRSNIKRWAKSPPAEAANMVPEKEADLERALERVASLLVGALPEKIPDASLQHTAVALGIVIDKLQLLGGKPTNIDEVRSDALGDDERAARVTALLDRARARRASATN